MGQERLKIVVRAGREIWRKMPLAMQVGCCIFLAASAQEIYLTGTATRANFRDPARVRQRTELIFTRSGGFILVFGGLIFLKAKSDRQGSGDAN